MLHQLALFQLISDEEAKRAIARPLDVTTRVTSGYYPAYLDFVRRTLRRDYRDEDLTEAGLKVFTSLDPRVQATGEQALNDELTRLDKQRKTKDGAKLEGAIVVTAPQSGDVIAVIGGRQLGFDGFNRALDARRSIGSLAKPMIGIHGEQIRNAAWNRVRPAAVQLFVGERVRRWGGGVKCAHDCDPCPGLVRPEGAHILQWVAPMVITR